MVVFKDERPEGENNLDTMSGIGRGVENMPKNTEVLFGEPLR